MQNGDTVQSGYSVLQGASYSDTLYQKYVRPEENRYPETKLKGVWRMSHPPTLKILPFPRAKIVVKYTCAGQFTGKRTIGELLLQNKVTDETIS